MNAVFPLDGHGFALRSPKGGAGHVLPPCSPHGRTHGLVLRKGGRVLRSPKGGRGLVLRSPKGGAGFTLVEMIAVIAIISILAATVIAGLVYAGRKAAITATDALFQRLEIGIRAFHTDYGKYPPHRMPTAGWSSIDSSTGDPPDHWFPMPDQFRKGADIFTNLNTGTEILWYFLAGVYEDATDGDLKDMEHKTPYVDFRQKELKRTGVAFLNVKANLKEDPDPAAPNDLFPEIIDPWGSPIQYNASGYPAPLPEPLANKDTFDLISRGPDRRAVTPYNARDEKVTVGGNDVYPNRDNIGNFKLP